MLVMVNLQRFTLTNLDLFSLSKSRPLNLERG